MYSTITGFDPVFAAASISMNIPKIINARRAYLESPSAENKQAYIAALENLYQDHWSGVKYTSGENSYTAPIYKADGILDNREAAQLTAKFQQRNTRGTTFAPTVSSVYNDAIARLDRALPRIPTSQMVGGTWEQQSASSTGEAVFNSLYESVKKQRNGSPRPAEDRMRAKLLTNAILKEMTYKSSAMFVSIENKDTGDTIRAFVNPRTSANSPKIKASASELKMASESLAKVRENSNVEQPLTLSLIATSTILPTREKFRGHGSNTMGYAFAGGGAHLYVDRIASSGLERERGIRPSDDGWWSTNVTNTKEVYMHVGAHEIGHVVMYKVWGNDTLSSKGERELESDYRKFNVMDNISKYGKKSVAEHFAEAYARYVITGEATPEFRALLESKNLLKSQKKN